MTTELTKAAQQALEALKNVTDYDQINAARRALQSALAQRPAAQEVDERKACGVMHLIEDYAKAVHDGDDALCQVLLRTIEASLPAPQQATPEPSRGCIACAARDAAIGQPPCADVPQAYLEWLATKSRSAGVGGNEAWNAGVEWQKQQPTPEPVGEVVAWQRRDRNIVTGEWSEWHEDDDIEEVLDPEWAERRPLFARPAPGVPDGFALVPLKATPKVAMVLYEGARNCFSPKVAEGLWQDALAAAQAKGGE